MSDDQWEPTSQDVTALVRQWKASMEIMSFNKKFRVDDYITYSPIQKLVCNSYATALAVLTANQIGKTTTAAKMVRMHATGEYASWYTGPMMPKLNLIRPHSRVFMCLGTSITALRDGLCARILGDVANGQLGTGILPAESIVSTAAARGIAGAIDNAVIRHKDGTTTIIYFRSMDAGREAVQSISADMIFVDEMPTEMGLWTELLARLAATSGRIILTATNRKQQSPIAQWFREQGHPERQIIRGSIEDAGHLSEAQRTEIRERFKHDLMEYRVRVLGEDWSGGGLVLTCPRDKVTFNFDYRAIPPSVQFILGLDPNKQGMSESSHPCAAVQCVYIPETEEFWVLTEYREKQVLPETVARAILNFEYGHAPCAWGAAENSGAGVDGSYADMYRKLGVNMIGGHGSQSHATPVGLDIGYAMMDAAAIAGKLKIASTCRKLLEEWSTLERDEATNRPVAIMDDLLSATRYAFLCARKYSRPEYRFRENTGLTNRNGASQQTATKWGDGPGEIDIFTGQLNAGSDIEGMINSARRV
jgi:phage terminase large subunit-like protein